MDEVIYQRGGGGLRNSVHYIYDNKLSREKKNTFLYFDLDIEKSFLYTKNISIVINCERYESIITLCIVEVLGFTILIIYHCRTNKLSTKYLIKRYSYVSL